MPVPCWTTWVDHAPPDGFIANLSEPVSRSKYETMIVSVADTATEV